MHCALNVICYAGCQDAAGRQGAEALRKSRLRAGARHGNVNVEPHARLANRRGCVLHNTQSREATGKMLNSSSRNLSALVFRFQMSARNVERVSYASCDLVVVLASCDAR